MDIKCPHCGTEYEVEKQDIGRFVTCESCGKGFVAGTSKSSGEAQSSRCQLSAISALWICVAILVLNLTALVVLCGSLATFEKKMGEMKKEICEELTQMDKSRHHDASQIYDRMGRMKLY